MPPHTVRAMLVTALLACPGALAQDVHWSNPVGGDYWVGSNWQGGAPPTTTQQAVFAVGGTYTVTAAAPVKLYQMKFIGGDITFAPQSGARMYALVVGSASSDWTRLRGAAPGPYEDSGPSPNVSITNGTIDGVLSGLSGIGLSSGAIATVSSIFSFISSVSVDATSRLTAYGSITVNQFLSQGTIELRGAVVSAWTVNQSGGQLTAINSRIGGDSVSISGGPHTFINSSVGPDLNGISASIGGDATFTGPYGGLPNIRDNTLIAGVVRLREGATAGSSIPVYGMLDLGPGCAAGWLRLYDGAVVRVSPQATVSALMYLTGGRLEVEVDALQLPTVAPVTFYGGDGAGELALQVANPNVLRVGHAVPIFADSASDQRVQFSSVQLPELPGGRALQLAEAATGYELRVVAGGSNPCWTADFNGDGDTGTDQDIEAFFACLGGNCCSTCGSADFNSDGDTATDQDIEAFFHVLGGGSC
ncbi:MAG TPA: hypothetical protein VD997_05960 [Phycisphaerales bacterium]|nr:hypothetical protein [Phycisphaerales bacterium]